VLPEQPDVVDSKKVPYESAAQTATVEEFAHVEAADGHVELALHAQEAEPALPVQLWRAPRQATGVPYDQQPLLPIVQVARLPATHVVCPDEQLLVQVVEQAALGAVPEQDSGLWHVDVEAT
jgi:hypothetical protein